MKEIEFVAPSAEFEPAGIDVVNLSTQMQSGGSKSLMAVRMYYGRATNAPLIDNDALEDAFEVKINALNLKRDIRTQHFEKYSPTLKRGFIRLTLAEGDFLHKEYSKVLLWYAINAGQEGQVAIPNSTGTVTVPPVPNEPYTPATNSISLDYTSEQLITHGDNIVGGDGSPIDQYFQSCPSTDIKGWTFSRCSRRSPSCTPIDRTMQFLWAIPTQQATCLSGFPNYSRAAPFPCWCRWQAARKWNRKCCPRSGMVVSEF